MSRPPIGRSASARKQAAVKAGNKFVLFLRECLLLLAMQVVTVTYVAGLSPPGGVWPETKGGHLIGNPILSVTEQVRYIVFSCGNAGALVASAAVAFLLLCFGEKTSQLREFSNLLRAVMSTGTVALAVAYAAGARGDNFTTIFVSVLVALFSLHTGIYTARWVLFVKEEVPKEEDFLVDRDGGIARYMLTAIFVATMTYTVGLSPPGGFWQEGDPALPAHHRARFEAFFVGNTVAFVASLFSIPLVLTNSRDQDRSVYRIHNFYQGMAQWGLLIAYAFGSNIDKSWTIFTFLSGYAIAPMLAIIRFIWNILPRFWERSSVETSITRALSGGSSVSSSKVGIDPFFITLFTTISASTTYQAGLNPPGGLWPDDRDGHKAFDPVLLARQPGRYMAFTYFNTLALETSLVAMVMVLTEKCQHQKSRILDALLILDMMGLIGAYATGCCRDLTTSLYVVSLGGAVVSYVVCHMAFLMSRSQVESLVTKDEMVERDRDLMLGILGASLTYQTGLNPPGGFRTSDDVFGRHLAGEPALLSTYPPRYTAFFYLNAICFMASIFLTMLFVNPLLYRAGIRCHALFICMLAVLFSLMAAYTAGSYRDLGSSIGVIALGVAAFISLFLVSYRLKRLKSSSSADDSQPVAGPQTADEQEEEKMDKALMYLVTIGCVGTTVTYLAGFAPPRGFWPDDSNSHAAGNPVLRDTHAHLYRIFFFFNTTAFAASFSIMSFVPVVYTLTKFLKDQYTILSFLPVPNSDSLLAFLKAPTLLHALGILVAYATGSTSGWNNSWVYLYAAILIAPVLFCIFGIDRLCQYLQDKRNKPPCQRCGQRH